MGLRVVVVGIPGVGKTTLVELLVSGSKGAKLVNFGTVMLEAGRSLKWIKDRDELRKMPIEKQRRLQKVAAARIAGIKGGMVVIDTHLFIRTDEGLWPGLPFEVVRAMRPTHLVLVEATPEEIAKRRASDRSRYRDSLALESLAEELGLARSFLTASSTLTGAPMSIVWNEEGKQERLARKLVKMLEQAAR